MKVLAIITTRWKSTRFPGKALADLCGKPVTQHIVDRLRQVKSIDEVVVIPSVDSQPIVDYCNKHNIACLEHHKDYDYLGQIMLGALVYQPEYIVRVWGDCPLIDPTLIERTIKETIDNGWGYAYCAHPDIGFTVSVFPTITLLATLRRMTNLDKDIFNETDEHVYFMRNYTFGIIYAEGDYSKEPVNLSVDTPEDLERVKQYLCQQK